MTIHFSHDRALMKCKPLSLGGIAEGLASDDLPMSAFGALQPSKEDLDNAFC